MVRSLRPPLAPACIWLVATLVMALVSGRATAADGPRRNVLLIAFDDLRPELGCYGSRLAVTPNIDALAGTSVRFERAYCQFPLCNPSRTSLLTGRHPNTTGVLDNQAFVHDAHPDFVTLPRHFRNAGYVTAQVGKIFHGGIDDTDAWTLGGEKRLAPKTPSPQDRKQSDRIVTLEGDGGQHPDFRTAARAVTLLEQVKDRPFFLAVGFQNPHSPPRAPARCFAQHAAAEMPFPTDFAPRPTVPAGFPAACLPSKNHDLFNDRDATPEEAREMVEAYYASVTFVDEQLGRVMQAVDRFGLRDNTVIVLFSDHGYHLGEKGKWSKHGSMFEVACRVPLLISLKGDAAGGSSPRTVQLLDIFPTLCDACGIAPPPGLEGHSLLPLLRDPLAAWDHPAFTVCRNGATVGESVRTERWRYSEFGGGTAGAVLFDHESDPHETKNLVDDPEQRDTVTHLNRLLHFLPVRNERSPVTPPR